MYITRNPTDILEVTAAIMVVIKTITDQLPSRAVWILTGVVSNPAPAFIMQGLNIPERFVVSNSCENSHEDPVNKPEIIVFSVLYRQDTPRSGEVWQN